MSVIHKNIIVSISFLMFWAVLVIVEVKLGTYEILKYLYLGSLPIIIYLFYKINYKYLTEIKGVSDLLSLVILAVVSGLYIFLGIVFIVNFKFMIGGSL